MYYFGYGSNLNVDDVARWCAETGEDASGMRRIGRAWLPDYEPVFHYRSRARGGGALDLRPAFARAVRGALYEVDDAGWRALDRKEGAPNRYARTRVNVLVDDGEVREAATYVVRPELTLGAHVPPTDAYLALVAAGLAEVGFDDGPLRGAAESLDGAIDPSAVFVYGTLLRGELRAPIIAREQPVSIESATTHGELVDLGAYPGLVLVDRGGEEAKTIQGELVHMHDAAPLLDALDEVEDFEGYGLSNMYRRIIVPVRGQSGGQATWAWTYRYVGEHARSAPRIASGDWRKRG